MRTIGANAAHVLESATPAAAEPVPGSEIDPVVLEQRMDRCLEYAVGESEILAGWFNFSTGEVRNWRCSSLRHMLFDDENRRSQNRHDPYVNIPDFIRCAEKAVRGFPRPGDAVSGMRPPGVVARVQGLIDEHRASEHADPERAPGAASESFVRLCGRVGFGDVGEERVLEAHRAAVEARYVAGTGFGVRLARCVDDVGAALAGLNDEQRADDVLRSIFTSIARDVVLGAREPDASFHLVCVTSARSALDGIDTPYLAARAAANMAVYRPPEDFGILAAGERLAVRYEDEPHARDLLDVEIRDELARYLAAVPFDV